VLLVQANFDNKIFFDLAAMAIVVKEEDMDETAIELFEKEIVALKKITPEETVKQGGAFAQFMLARGILKAIQELKLFESEKVFKKKYWIHKCRKDLERDKYDRPTDIIYWRNIVHSFCPLYSSLDSDKEARKRLINNLRTAFFGDTVNKDDDNEIQSIFKAHLSNPILSLTKQKIGFIVEQLGIMNKIEQDKLLIELNNKNYTLFRDTVFNPKQDYDFKIHSRCGLGVIGEKEICPKCQGKLTKKNQIDLNKFLKGVKKNRRDFAKDPEKIGDGGSKKTKNRGIKFEKLEKLIHDLPGLIRTLDEQRQNKESLFQAIVLQIPKLFKEKGIIAAGQEQKKEIVRERKNERDFLPEKAKEIFNTIFCSSKPEEVKEAISKYQNENSAKVSLIFKITKDRKIMCIEVKKDENKMLYGKIELQTKDGIIVQYGSFKSNYEPKKINKAKKESNKLIELPSEPEGSEQVPSVVNLDTIKNSFKENIEISMGVTKNEKTLFPDSLKEGLKSFLEGKDIIKDYEKVEPFKKQLGQDLLVGLEITDKGQNLIQGKRTHTCKNGNRYIVYGVFDKNKNYQIIGNFKIVIEIKVGEKDNEKKIWKKLQVKSLKDNKAVFSDGKVYAKPLSKSNLPKKSKSKIGEKQLTPKFISQVIKYELQEYVPGFTVPMGFFK
ncbi:hypothetical protein ACFLZV_05885, partial [Candidatus Margulisiibacteriota bacterium]